MASIFQKLPIHAFEPTPESYELLAKRTAKYDNVATHQIALGAETGTTTFFLNTNALTNSLLDNTLGNTLFLPKATQHESQVEVEIRSLDDWIGDHAAGASLVAKVDIQGAELLLIQGGRRTFQSQVHAVLFEVEYRELYKGGANFFDIHETLTKDYDFELAQLYPTFQLGHRAAWGDAMYVHKRFTS